MHRGARHLEEVIIKTDGPEADGHKQYRPDIKIAKVGPQQCRDENSRENHQAAHGGRTLLFNDMTLWSVQADWLSPALLHLEQGNDFWPENKNEQQCRDDGAARSGGQVFENVEGRNIVSKAGCQIVKHRFRIPSGFATGVQPICFSWPRQWVPCGCPANP